MGLREVNVLLLYPPNQAEAGTVCKPNGSLAYPYLGGALRRHGVEVRIFDACVGREGDPLKELFTKPTVMPNGMLRVGVSDERILQEVADFDIIGITSIFTDQESMVLHCARLVRAAYPDKILVSGGVNARSRMKRFFDAGFDAIAVSEGEQALIDIVDAARLSKNPDYSAIGGVASMRDGEIVVNRVRSEDIVWDLDETAMPAWDLLPNDRYWALARPHSGMFEYGAELRFNTMMTSLGCPFACKYCHIAGEQDGDMSGPIGTFRIKSDDRVLAEIDTIKGLGADHVFIEDDSLLGNKPRGLRLLRKIQDANVTVVDLNGINIVHLLKRWKPDHEVIEALVDAGFTQLNMPFESGNQRILKKYASNKLNVELADLEGLIKTLKHHGIQLFGNYMMGYPDETREEIERTIDLAKEHMSYGMDGANFFVVLPLPGSPLYDMAIEGGHFDEDFDPDRMNIYKANMKNTLVPADELEALRSRAWDEVNLPEFKETKRGWATWPSDDESADDAA